MGGIVSKTGSSGSKYKLEADDAPAETSAWIAPATVDVGALKADNFRTKNVTGKGKFGCVYLSQNVKTKQYVAIKFISYQMIFEGKHAERVDQELRVVKELDHPFIIHFFGAYRTPGSVAMVFEFAMGGELYHRMKQQVSMSEHEAKFYACEIAMALDYLHNTAGIVYRDLKPENVLLDSQGHVKICDFGFAAPLDAAQSLTDGCGTFMYLYTHSPISLPHPHTHRLRCRCGTVMYLAPEIAAGQKSSKHGLPVDWWSLGCILYEIVTGNAPFGDTDKESKFAILNNINGKKLRYPMSMSSELKEVLEGLIKKDDQRRWKCDDVRRCAFGPPGNAPPAPVLAHIQALQPPPRCCHAQVRVDGQCGLGGRGAAADPAAVGAHAHSAAGHLKLPRVGGPGRPTRAAAGQGCRCVLCRPHCRARGPGTAVNEHGGAEGSHPDAVHQQGQQRRVLRQHAHPVVDGLVPRRGGPQPQSRGRPARAAGDVYEEAGQGSVEERQECRGWAMTACRFSISHFNCLRCFFTSRHNPFSLF